MNIELFVQRTELLRQRLEDLYQTANVLPWIPSDLIPEAFKELYTTSQMLQLAVEELYQQNEEFIQTRKLLETQRQHYQDLFEFAPVAYLITNQQGIIQEANHVAEKLLNISANFLVGKPIIIFIPHEQHPYFYNKLTQISQSQKIQKLLLPLQPRESDKFDASLKVKSFTPKHGKTTNLHWLIQKISEHHSIASKTFPIESDLIDDFPINKYSKGELIALNPLLICYVRQGLVKLSTFSEIGEELVTGLATSGMVFSPSMTSLATYQAKALTDVELASISLTEITVSPSMNEILLPKIQQRLQQTESFLFITSRKKVQDRLHHLLDFLKKKIGEPVPEGTRLTFRLTHEDIASICGTTRVTITRLLSQFEQQGIISFDHKKHIICNRHLRKENV
ncbi:helix-turn-helix domain-containing protein [Anabaena sp. UHCC 0451]|uniref:helix-turn-helix domain-containing protein n=1 Tax=Anabaena sp. UHCC 0451 TaxID=2055235 RepID=UPI002B2048A6|nr:helix-turn-helix domain-containing protein [Anabaena sp. UHCC 0451]MEA5575634.1 helix-turn-helix domain-containing protein [Anabaena sp. UHCC 0451]